MSILLALLRSPGTYGASRSRRNRAALPIHNEVELLSRSKPEGTELQAFPSGSLSQPSEPAESPRQENEAQKCDVQIPTDKDLGPDGARDLEHLSAEVSFALDYINGTLTEDVNMFVHKALERLCWSGSVLCKLLATSIPGSLDERAINCSSSGDIADAEALENFQLCHSCAQAQGCDVQSLTAEQLQTCEAPVLADFVLEVLRMAAVQALPPGDRHWLLPPAPPEAAAAAAAAPAQAPRPPPGTPLAPPRWTARPHTAGPHGEGRSNDMPPAPAPTRGAQRAQPHRSEGSGAGSSSSSRGGGQVGSGHQPHHHETVREEGGWPPGRRRVRSTGSGCAARDVGDPQDGAEAEGTFGGLGSRG
ncbi:hypothetical protein Agub_g9697, partial [Astrephomene gubernaculifera]